MKIKLSLLALVFGLSSVLLCCGNDLVIPVNQAPEPVQKSISKLAGGSKLLRLEKAVDEGVVTYEALTLKNDGGKIEFIMGPDGSLKATEEPLKWSELKGDVARAAEEAVGKGKAGEIERVTRNGETTYEIAYTTNKMKFEAVISSEGRLLKNTPESD